MEEIDQEVEQQGEHEVEMSSNHEINRHYLKATRATMLCAECKTMQEVTDYYPNKQCQLTCGHRRNVGLRRN